MQSGGPIVGAQFPYSREAGGAVSLQRGLGSPIAGRGWGAVGGSVPIAGARFPYSREAGREVSL